MNDENVPRYDGASKEFDDALNKKNKGKKLSKANSAKLDKALEKLANDVKPEKKTSKIKVLTIAEQYRTSWKVVYNKCQPWRQQEIDRFIKNKDYDNRHYTSFVQEVIENTEYQISS